MKSRQLFSVFFLILTCGALLSASAKAPKHGWLSTYKNYVLNEKGNIVQLRGMSMYWSTPGWIGHSWYNSGVVDALVDNWKCTVIRVAWDRNNGANNGADVAQSVIDYCIQKGIYVVIDWHSHTAHENESQAVDYFRGAAQQYKDVPNVIFEIYNEPIVAGGAEAENGFPDNARKTWTGIRPYSVNVTKAIRETGSKNLIIIGTPYYCQHIGVAAENPVDDNGKPFENLAYAFHFYAASHGPKAMYVERDGGGNEATYLETGMYKLPVFVSEWGTCHRDGAQSIDETNTNWWFDEYIDPMHMSWCAWSASSGETSSAFGGSANDPSASGRIVKGLLSKHSEDEWIPEWVGGLPGPAGETRFDMPTEFHPSASYNAYYGSMVEVAPAGFSTRDKIDRRIDGTRAYDVLKVSPSSNDNWVRYKIKSSSATGYILMRYLGEEGGGTVEVLVDGNKAGEVSLEQSDDWEYAIVPADISAGDHELDFNFVNGDGFYKIEWFELTNSSSVPVVGTTLKRGISTIPVSLLPTHNSLSVILPPDHNFRNYSVFGANGRTVQTAQLHNGVRALTVENLSRGIWFVKLEKNGSHKLMKTFVGSR